MKSPMDMECLDMPAAQHIRAIGKMESSTARAQKSLKTSHNSTESTGMALRTGSGYSSGRMETSMRETGIMTPSVVMAPATG